MAEREVAKHRELWFAQLRERFLALARRRVPPDAAEDLVQEALRIIHEKGATDEAGAGAGGGGDSPPALAWCFQVLRNVIGNHYQRQRTRTEADPEEERAATVGAAPRPTPLEALESRDSERVIRESIDELAATDGNCGRYLRQLLAGDDPATVAQRDALPAASLYRRLYRCRGKLRVILERRGILT